LAGKIFRTPAVSIYLGQEWKGIKKKHKTHMIFSKSQPSKALTISNHLILPPPHLLIEPFGFLTAASAGQEGGQVVDAPQEVGCH
jgi:hypothetical protein